MKRDDRLVRLSWDHHHALVFARRIAVELPTATDDEAGALYSDLVAFYAAGLLPHFRLEGECLLGRLVRAVAPEHEAVRRTLDDHLYLEALVMTMRDTADPAERRESLRRLEQGYVMATIVQARFGSGPIRGAARVRYWPEGVRTPIQLSRT